MREVIHFFFLFVFFQKYFAELFGSVAAPPSPLLSKLDRADALNLRLNKMQKVQSVRLI